MGAVLESAGACSPRTPLTTISTTPARHKTAIRMSWLNLAASSFCLSRRNTLERFSGKSSASSQFPRSLYHHQAAEEPRFRVGSALPSRKSDSQQQRSYAGSGRVPSTITFGQQDGLRDFRRWLRRRPHWRGFVLGENRDRRSRVASSGDNRIRSLPAR
jgi:hypothetical protein